MPEILQTLERERQKPFKQKKNYFFFGCQIVISISDAVSVL